MRMPTLSPTKGSGALGAPSARRGFNLVRWFVLVSLVCVVVSGAGTAALLDRFLTERMLSHDAELTADFLQGVVDSERRWNWFGDGSPGGEDFFELVARLPGVVRANVFGRDGTLLWSTNPDLIGQRFEANPALDRALRGRTSVEAGTEPKAEHLALDRDVGGRRFTEAYLPVRDEARRAVIGVVEIYRLPDTLFQAIDEGVQRVWLAAGGGMALLYLALFGIARRAHRLILRQHQRLVEAEALSAIGAVASAVAHGIRNPLASIRSSAELGQVEDAEGVERCFADIQREADRVERWVRDLLAQTRGEAVVPAAVDVNLVLAESARTLTSSAARQGVAIATERGGVPRALADAGALGQAFDNLIANAIEAMPEGGRLLLSTRAAPDGHQVEIAIADTGPGLPKEVLHGDALFFSSKPRGSGLGLMLTRRILERHGGSLALESGPGGTRAVIRLPVAEGA
jgi:signal transduction histidine kinase